MATTRNMKEGVCQIFRIVIIFGIVLGIFAGLIVLDERNISNKIESIIERPNSTLVCIKTNLNTTFTSYIVYGYLDNDLMDAFINKELEKNIKVYNPYNDEFVLVNTDIITSIKTISKREFVVETKEVY